MQLFVQIYSVDAVEVSVRLMQLARQSLFAVLLSPHSVVPSLSMQADSIYFGLCCWAVKVLPTADPLTKF